MGDRTSRSRLLGVAGLAAGALAVRLTTWIAAPPVAAQDPVPTGFLNGQVKANGRTMVYVVYVPRNYVAEKQGPVILFLHGSLAEGHDGFHPLMNTLPRGTNFNIAAGSTVAGSLGVAVMRNSQRFPCLVVWPQQPEGTAGWGGPNADLALRVLEEVVGKYNGDRSRLYLTGISSGGGGAWTMAADHPELFAAAIPIAAAGNSPTEKAAQALKSMPLWVFHGGADRDASPAVDRKWVAAIQAAGSTSIQYTEFPGMGHNVWDTVYDDPKVIAWLLAQHR
jgi:predicted peptidase